MIAIEKLILIILFLVVLVAGIMILTGYVLPVGGNINLRNELNQCCQKYRAFNCPDVGSLGNINCTTNSLAYLFGELGFSDIKDLRKYCNCQGEI